jgi:hypothetical protein
VDFFLVIGEFLRLTKSTIHAVCQQCPLSHMPRPLRERKPEQVQDEGEGERLSMTPGGGSPQQHHWSYVKN